MSKVQFGWAEVDITPENKIALAGEFYERVTNEVETPITMTALAIDADGEQAVIVSCDLVGIYPDMVKLAREKVNIPGFDSKKIIAAAIHTHNSYLVASLEGGCDSVVAISRKLQPYMDETCEYVPEDSDKEAQDPIKSLYYLADKLAEVVTLAWNDRKPAGYAHGFGRAAIGMARRACYSDGTAKMWGDVDTASFTELEDGTDSGIEMLFTYDENNKLTGVVANVSCPAQILEQRTIISSDYWGKVKILLRRKYGEDLKVLALCAPAGDLCPRDLIRWVEPETPIKDPNVIRNDPKPRRADPSMFDIKGTWVAGRRIANEIEAALEDVTEIRTDAVMKHEVKTLDLPLRRVTPKQFADAEAGMRAFFRGKKKVNYIDSAEVYVHLGDIERYYEQETREYYSSEVHYLRFDDVAFATSPFELFHHYANIIRARSDAKQTFLIQLSCGDGGYLPTEKAEKAGHYSAYVASGNVGHEGGDILVRDALDAIRGMFKED